MDALEYLTGSEEGQRGLQLQTLLKYNVGLGTEKFTDDEGVYQGYDSIYFPLYAPKNGKTSRLDTMRHMKIAQDMKRVGEAEALIDTDLAELVKMKVRAAYKENKSKQRVIPRESDFR